MPFSPFAIEIDTCRHCGRRLSVIASIEDSALLAHLKRPAEDDPFGACAAAAITALRPVLPSSISPCHATHRRGASLRPGRLSGVGYLRGWPQNALRAGSAMPRPAPRAPDSRLATGFSRAHPRTSGRLYVSNRA
jgi:hypothetical protein